MTIAAWTTMMAGERWKLAIHTNAYGRNLEYGRWIYRFAAQFGEIATPADSRYFEAVKRLESGVDSLGLCDLPLNELAYQEAWRSLRSKQMGEAAKSRW